MVADVVSQERGRGLRPNKYIQERKGGFSVSVWGIFHAHVRYQYVYKTRPSFLDRGILAQTVKEERNISNGSDSLGSR